MTLLLLDLIFPRICVGCNKPGAYLCAFCLNRLQKRKFQICPVCSRWSLRGATHPKCNGKRELDGIYSIFSYNSLSQELILKLKYKFVTDLCDTLVESAVSLDDLSFLDQYHFTLTSVPLHKDRERWRGFNQSREIGLRLGKYFKYPYQELLVRNKFTQPQMRLPKEERLSNVKGVFSLLGTEIKDKNILLIDDVWTTGATMRECAKVLKKGGAGVIWGLTLASGAK